MKSHGFATSDPYRIYLSHPWSPENYDPSGYTAVSGPLVGGENTAVIVLLGQSNAGNHAQGAYTVTQSKNHNFNIGNGGMYASQSSLLGCTGRTDPNWFARVGDKLIAAGKFTRVILVPIAIGGTSIADWAVGGICNHRIGVAAARLAARGLLSAVTRIYQHQGENDQILATSQAAYAASQSSVISTIRAKGFTAPYYICKVSYVTGSTSAAVRAAQAAAVDNATIFAGPDTDSFTAASRFDNLHWNAAGQESVADAVVAQF